MDPGTPVLSPHDQTDASHAKAGEEKEEQRNPHSPHAVVGMPGRVVIGLLRFPGSGYHRHLPLPHFGANDLPRLKRYLLGVGRQIDIDFASVAELQLLAPALPSECFPSPRSVMTAARI